MPLTSFNRYTNRRVQPQFFPHDVRYFGAPFVAGAILAAGTIVSFVTATAANDVYTLTPGGSVSGGSVTLVVYGASVTILATDTAAAVQTKINNALVGQWGQGNGVTVTGGPLTSAPLVVTAAGSFAAQPQVITVTSNNLTGSSPTITATHTTTGVANNAWNAYASGNSDGTQTARAILPVDVAVDPTGGIWLGSAVGSGSQVRNMTEAVATNGGQWNIADLIGLDAAAVASLGQLISGSLASGIGILELEG